MAGSPAIAGKAGLTARLVDHVDVSLLRVAASDPIQLADRPRLCVPLLKEKRKVQPGSRGRKEPRSTGFQERHAVQSAPSLDLEGQEEDGQSLCQWSGKDCPLRCQGVRTQLFSCRTQEL